MKIEVVNKMLYDLLQLAENTGPNELKPPVIEKLKEIIIEVNRPDKS